MGIGRAFLRHHDPYCARWSLEGEGIGVLTNPLVVRAH